MRNVKGPMSKVSEYNDEMGKAIGAEQTRDFAGAREIYLQLIKARPDMASDTRHFIHLGLLVCDSQHKAAEAQGYYATAIRMQPKNADLVNDLGYSYFLQGKLDKAEASIRQAVAMKPDGIEIPQHNLGLVLGNQKKYDAAWQEFRIAGGDAQAFYNLAFIYGSQNNFKAAKASFQKALAIDPTNEKAQRALRTFELAETDPTSLVGYETFTPDGRRWVAYDENSPPDGANKTPSSNDNTASAANRTADSTHRIAGHQFQPAM